MSVVRSDAVSPSLRLPSPLSPLRVSTSPRLSFSQRGSTLILVLALLSILILIAATLSYTARLEEISSRNFADGVQARMAAQTGVAFFFAVVDGRTSSVAETRQVAAGRLGDRNPAVPAPCATPPPLPPPQPGTRTLARGTSIPLARSGMTVLAPPTETRATRFSNMSSVATDLAHLCIVDESSKININRMGSWVELQGDGLAVGRAAPLGAASANDTVTSATAIKPVALADALYAVLSSPEVGYRGASRETARNLARAILAYRYGRDGQPGFAGVDDDGDGSATKTALLSSRSPRSGGVAAPGIIPSYLPFSAYQPISMSGAAQTAPSTVNIERDGLDNDGDGRTDEVGEGTDEPDEFIADPRLPPNGDDCPFRQVEDLLRVQGMTVELFNALRPYITVFSASERRVGPERNALAQMDLNTASAEQIQERLKMAFPHLPDDTLAQFAANLVDYRDADAVPTQVRPANSIEPVFGTEVTPAISEVYPDSVTDDFEGDDGEYIELYNPYDTAIALSGWTLRINGGVRIPLHGTLAPGGFLIVTDDYNGRVDARTEPRSQGYGSFYDIFGVVPNSRNHLMVEIADLDIPNRSGLIELADKAGNIVDQFRYGGDAAGGLRRSYQRKDPRIRIHQAARCTPYVVPEWSDIQNGQVISWNLIRASSVKNAPIQSALELFNISAPVAVGQSRDTVEWRAPKIGAAARDSFNETIVDYFTVWTDGRAGNAGRISSTLDSATGVASPLLALNTATSEAFSVAECGRINLNSAPAPLLRALRGITEDQIDVLLSRRETTSRTDTAGLPAAHTRLSEWIADDEFWNNAALSTRVSRLSLWIGSIGFSSNGYTIFSENRPQPPSGPRLASRSKIESLVSTDQRRNQVVFWRYVE